MYYCSESEQNVKLQKIPAEQKFQEKFDLETLNPKTEFHLAML